MILDSLRAFFPPEFSQRKEGLKSSSQAILDAINSSDQKSTFTELIMLDLKERKKGEVYYKGYSLSLDDIEAVLQRFPAAQEYRRFTLELSFNIGSHEVTNMSHKLWFRTAFEALGRHLYPSDWEKVVEKPRRKRKKDTFKQSKKYRDTGRLSGEISDGFTDVGRGGVVKSDNTSTTSITREILVVDRREDVGLQEILSDARKIVETTSNKLEALFLVAKQVFDLMNRDEEIEEWVERHSDFANTELFIGDYDQRYNAPGVCRHMALLFHTVACDLGFRSTLVRGYYRCSYLEEAHTWCELDFNGKRYVVDLAGDSGRYRQDFGHFQKSGGFPETNPNVGLAQIYVRKKYFDVSGKLLYSID